LRLAIPLVLLAALATSCGGRGTPVDETGLVLGGGETSVFARASQLYFRGSLSRAREEFNAVIYRFPDSRLVEEARLAVRRIDIDLGLQAADTSGHVAGTSPSVAVVGLPQNGPRIARLVSALTARGYDASAVQDEGAPDMTLLLYPDGLEQEAQTLAESLSSWLAQPPDIPVQPGGQITEAILPGHAGLVVVVGSDAVISASAPLLQTD
jgi:hypothetical protein